MKNHADLFVPPWNLNFSDENEKCTEWEQT
jgi:hypothetical protein